MGMTRLGDANCLKNVCMNSYFYTTPITRRQTVDSSKSKEFADNNFKLDENGSQFYKQKTLREKEKLLVTSNFSFFHSDFKSLVLMTG